MKSESWCLERPLSYDGPLKRCHEMYAQRSEEVHCYSVQMERGDRGVVKVYVFLVFVCLSGKVTV